MVSGPEGRTPAENAVGAEVIGRGKCTYSEKFPATALVCRTGIFKKSPKKVGCRAWNLPTPKSRSKTPPRPLREALRIRMGKLGREDDYLVGRPLHRQRPSPYPWINRALNPVDPWLRNTRRGRTERLIAQRLEFVTQLPTDEVRRGIDIVIIARIHDLQGQVPKQLVLLQEETFLQLEIGPHRQQ